MNIIRRIKAYIRLKKNKDFLKKHHCRTWKQYKRDYDPDMNHRASFISQIYHGYPYLVVFKPNLVLPKNYNTWVEWLVDVIAWCDKNCLDKFRYDVHRVSEGGLTHNTVDDTISWEDYTLNEVVGKDCLFFAFKDSRDVTWFKLTWH